MQEIQYPFKNDHEVVIALIEDFNNAIEEFNSQAINTGRDLVDIKKILIEQNAKVEQRLSTLEKEWLEIDPKVLAKTVQENSEWIKKFNNTKHVAWVFACVFFGIIGYIINVAVQYMTRIYH